MCTNRLMSNDQTEDDRYFSLLFANVSKNCIRACCSGVGKKIKMVRLTCHIHWPRIYIGLEWNT
jgi:hypothetical protein